MTADSCTAYGARMLSLGRWVVAAVAVVVLALVVGGYGMGWRWTGLAQGVTLWNWLEALLLPLALGLVPVLLLQREGLRQGHRLLVAGVTAAFTALVIAATRSRSPGPGSAATPSGIGSSWHCSPSS